MMFKWIAIHVAWIMGTYIIGWTIGYTMVAGGDYSYYFRWLADAWTGRGFEMAYGAQLIAVLFTALWWIVFVVILVARRRSSRTQ